MTATGTQTSIQKPSKLKELVLYVARQCREDERFDLAKLGRILFYSDFWSYCQAGRSISGAEYRLGETGPRPQELRPLLEDLRSDGSLAIEKGRPAPLREPDVTVFSDHELCCVDEVIGIVWRLDAAEITSFPPEGATA